MSVKRYIALSVIIFPILTCRAQSLSTDRIEEVWAQLYDKACLLYEKKNYYDAEKTLNNSIDILKQNDAEGGLGNIKSLALLGRIYYETQDQNSLTRIEMDLQSIKDRIKPGSIRYIHSLYEISVYYSSIGKYKKTINLLQEAMGWSETVRSIPGMQSKLLHYQAVANYGRGDLQRAIEFEKECISHDHDGLPEYRIALVYYYYLNKDWDGLEMILPECYESVREPILRHFSMSKSPDRAVFWEEKGGFFYMYLPTFIYEHYSSLIAAYTYDAALFSKGVLLAAENKSTEITLSSDNPELIKLFERYRVLKSKKKRSMEETAEMEAYSDVLLRYQKEHKYDFRTDFRIGWQDVQSQLGEHDIAIEFVSVPQQNGTTKYIALSIKKGDSAPHLTKLNDFTELLTEQSGEIYTDNELYDIIWGALENELDGVENVYFSPTGFLFNTGIEYLPDEMGINFCYKYNTFRVSSTKELVLRRNGSYDKAAFFGGVDYDLSPIKDTVASQHEGIDSVRSVSFDSLRFDGLRDGSVSKGFSYLPGTLKEVDSISKMLMDSRVVSISYTGEDAKESAFKNLSSTDVGVIHVATHGFYYSDRGSDHRISMEKDFHELYFSVGKNNTHATGEDKRLTRSGLILAGANNTLRQKKGQKSGNDGILYAYEIAGLNLSNTDLVVLSACQSGLGDIDASEGVFGLQRGFKLAGVNSIVMSLWKVNDEATRILMTEMYRNLYSGQTKREALSNAQSFLRSYNNGEYDYPKFWAAFVLLDALD